MSAPHAAPADVLVIFGITGDLARKMTFRSLYRLEQREMLDCPIVGVAVDDWTLEQLIEREPARFRVGRDLGEDHYDTRRGTERAVRNHIRRLHELGYRVTLEPAA